MAGRYTHERRLIRSNGGQHRNLMGRGALRPEVSDYESSETRRNQDRRGSDPSVDRDCCGHVPELGGGRAGITPGSAFCACPPTRFANVRVGSDPFAPRSFIATDVAPVCHECAAICRFVPVFAESRVINFASIAA